MRKITLPTLAALMLIAGCSVANNAIDTAVDRAAQRTGETVGDAVGQRVGEMAASMIMARFPDTWTGQWTTLYVNYLFSLAFHSGSYSVVEEAYEPGEWTRWTMLQGDEPTGSEFERAYLEQTDDGEEWWCVTYVNTEDDEEIVLEGLFSADRSELLRLRAQFPGEEAKELPVEEGTFSYAEPRQLTEQSLEGAMRGIEQVSVPAGSFQARHIEYGTAGSTLSWWINDDVPGNLVKYASRADEQDEDDAQIPETWTVELAEYGDGAEFRLQ